jgi:hypothetical protein
MRVSSSGLLGMAAAGLVAALPCSARADGPVAGAAPAQSAGDGDVERIAAAGHTLKWNWTPPGKDHRYGHAEVLVHAPIAAVRTIVQDYGHYKDLAGDKIKTTRVIAKDAGNTDVYTQIPIMNGLLTVWYVVRYSPIKVVTPGTEVIEGQMVKGSLRAMNGVWTMRAVNDSWTLVKLDLLALPNVMVPDAWIDEGLRDSAGQAIDAVHDRAQGDSHWVPWVSAQASASK